MEPTSYCQNEVHMQEVQRKYQQNMASLMPHSPDTDELAIVGASLTEALERQVVAPITLPQVLERLQEQSPSSYEQYVSLKAQRDCMAQAKAEQQLAVRSCS